MNETVKTLLARKSVRAYEPVSIPEKDVRLILESAVQAPSAGNMTLWSCIRVTDQALKKRLADLCDHQPFIADAPLVLLFYADYYRWFSAFQTLELCEPLRRPGQGDRMLASVDCIIAAHAAVTAAESMGYGTCYIGDVVENWETHRALFNLPEYVQPVCMAVIGVPTTQQSERTKPRRFKLDDIVYENTYIPRTPDEFCTMLKERQGIQTSEELNRWLLAFMKRKWNCDFSEEMSRSVTAMIADWDAGK